LKSRAATPGTGSDYMSFPQPFRLSLYSRMFYREMFIVGLVPQC
jgi:hypothetical protein